MARRNQHHHEVPPPSENSEEANSLVFNVSQLMREQFGTTRRYHLDVPVQDLAEGVQFVEPVYGDVRMTRTNRGLYLQADLRSAVEQECGRCLDPVVAPIRLRFSEEFHPTIDIVTGLPSHVDAEPEEFRIDDNHTIDLSEAVRQYTLVNVPLQVLCREDCAGLCPTCGENLNERQCGCADGAGTDTVDTRGLSKLREWLHEHESDDAGNSDRHSPADGRKS